MKRLGLCLALLLGSCSQTGRYGGGYSDYYPPPRFDHRFPGITLVRYEPASVAWRRCPNYGVACVVEVTDRYCVIIFNVDYMDDKDKILRHENGHCNGWNADHSN